MYRTFVLKIAVIPSTLLQLSAATPLGAVKYWSSSFTDLFRRQQYGVNCSDLSTGRSNECWAELHITDYLNDWLSKHTCYEDEPFSDCFSRQNGFPDLNCTILDVKPCDTPQISPLDIDPRVYYTAYNIYCKHFLFSPPTMFLLPFINPTSIANTNPKSNKRLLHNLGLRPILRLRSILTTHLRDRRRCHQQIRLDPCQHPHRYPRLSLH